MKPSKRLSAALLLALAAGLTGCMSGFIDRHFSGMTEELRERGVSARATILKIWDTGWTVNNDPVIGMEVEVRPADGAVFTATIKKTLISRIELPQFQPGRVVPVLYDPKAPAVVAVDFGGEAAESANAPPPILGVAIRSLEEEEKARFNREGGALVLAVTEGLPASAAGIRRGDIVLAFDGKPVADADALRALVTSAAGRSVAIDLDRDGRPLTVTVQLNPAAP